MMQAWADYLDGLRSEQDQLLLNPFLSKECTKKELHKAREKDTGAGIHCLHRRAFDAQLAVFTALSTSQ